MKIKAQNGEELNGLKYAKLHMEKSQKNKGSKTKGSFFVDQKKETTEDKIQKKREIAQKKAMKLMQDQFEKDGKTDLELEERQAHINQLSAEKVQKNEQIQELREANEKLREEYEVKEDSTEQSDLELMEKQMRIRNSAEPNKEMLTEEEQKRLSEMDPPTEYQQRVLDNYKDIVRYRNENYNSQRAIYVEGYISNEIKKSSVKNKGMQEAVDSAQEVMEGASSEIIGMMTSEIKKKIDEDAEKVRAEAKKKAEEKAEEEKKIEERKEKAEQMEKAGRQDPDKKTEGEEKAERVVQEIPAMEGIQDKVQIEIQQILEKAKLLPEDLKGIDVDILS